MNDGDVFLPVISPEDYDYFSQVLKAEIPTTYDRWQREVYASWNNRYKTKEFGNYNVREVKVAPDEFAKYLADNCFPHDMNSLRRFAEFSAKHG